MDFLPAQPLRDPGWHDLDQGGKFGFTDDLAHNFQIIGLTVCVFLGDMVSGAALDLLLVLPSQTDLFVARINQPLALFAHYKHDERMIGHAPSVAGHQSPTSNRPQDECALSLRGVGT